MHLEGVGMRLEDVKAAADVFVFRSFGEFVVCDTLGDFRDVADIVVVRGSIRASFGIVLACRTGFGFTRLLTVYHQ